MRYLIVIVLPWLWWIPSHNESEKNLFFVKIPEIVNFQNPTRIFTHIVCSMRKIAGILKNPKNSRRECTALPSNFLLSEHSLFTLWQDFSNFIPKFWMPLLKFEISKIGFDLSIKAIYWLKKVKKKCLGKIFLYLNH